MLEFPTTEAALDIRDAVTAGRAGGWIAPRAAMFTLAAIAQFAISPARADIMWTLSGVTFVDGGGAASGTFTTDASGNLTSADITTTSSLPRFPGTQYDTATGTLIRSLNSSGFDLDTFDPETGVTTLLLDFAVPLVPSSSPDAISIADEATAEFDRIGSDGSATTPTSTPEPTTLGLLATATAFLAASAPAKADYDRTLGTKANISANLIFAQPLLRHVDDFTRKESGSWSSLRLHNGKTPSMPLGVLIWPACKDNRLRPERY